MVVSIEGRIGNSCRLGLCRMALVSKLRCKYTYNYGLCQVFNRYFFSVRHHAKGYRIDYPVVFASQLRGFHFLILWFRGRKLAVFGV